MNGLYDGSSGGGVATAYAQPWYQKNVVPTKLAETEVTSTPITYNTGTAYGTVTLAYNESLTTASSPTAGDPGRVGAGRPVDRRRGGRDPLRPGQRAGRARS